eukprot:6199151-Pleurochrysis_carterae.AAC.1
MEASSPVTCRSDDRSALHLTWPFAVRTISKADSLLHLCTYALITSGSNNALLDWSAVRAGEAKTTKKLLDVAVRANVHAAKAT